MMTLTYEGLLEGLNQREQRALKTIEEIRNECKNRVDLVVQNLDLFNFIPEAERIEIANKDSSIRFKLTNFSKKQLLDKAYMPHRYYETLIELGLTDLAQDAILQVLRKKEKDLLIRAVNDTAKGVLSTRYMRLDGDIIIQMFYDEAKQKGFYLYDAMNTEYRYSLTMLKPIKEAFLDDDPLVWGLNLTTSDYGGHALEISLSVMRVVCENLAIIQTKYRKVHLGQEVGNVSKETLIKYYGFVFSMIRDNIQNFTPRNDIIAKAKEIPGEVGFVILEKELNKETLKQLKYMYELDIPVFPQGDSIWRVSNVVSNYAKNIKRLDEKIDLMKLAGDVLLKCTMN